MQIVSRLSPRLLKLVLIAAPMAMMALYIGVFAADRFVSESVVTVRHANQASGGTPGMAMLLAGIAPASREDTLVLRQYIHSLHLMQKLDARLKLRQHYEAKRLDVLFGLWPNASQENLLEYYRGRVEVSLDDVSGLLKLRVQGFDPEFSRNLNAAVLQESEHVVNALSHDMAREQMSFVEGEVRRSASKLQVAKADLLKFQSRHKLLDPMLQAQASGSMAVELQAQVTKHETELKTALTYLNEDSHQVRALKDQLDVLRGQVGGERARVTTKGGSEQLTGLASEFQDLRLQVGFAEDAYKLGLGAVENARIEATRKLKSVVVIEPPTLATTAEYPRRIYNLLTLLVVCSLLYGVARLIVATIRDHQD